MNTQKTLVASATEKPKRTLKVKSSKAESTRLMLPCQFMIF